VDGLAALTIITGLNGSCKSALVDALLVAASPAPGDAVGRVIARQRTVARGVHWLWHRSQRQDQSEQALVAARSSEGWWLARWMERGASENGGTCVEVTELAGTDADGYPPTDRPGRPARSGLMASIDSAERLLEDRQTDAPVWNVVVTDQNKYVVRQDQISGRDLAGTWRFVKLIDPADVRPLVTSFSEAERGGFGEELDALIDPLGYNRLKIMEDPGGGSFSLYVTPKGSVPVPVAIAGDGVYSLLQTAIHLATVPKGLALLEEPEVFQHPRSLGPCARAIIGAVERGVQVVVTTHSQELIDQLLIQAGDDRAERIAQFTVSMSEGTLHSYRLAGAKLLEARWTLGEDLR